MFKFVLAITGFMAGAALAGSIGYSISGGKEAVSFLMGIAGGLIGAALATSLYLMGIFLIGALLGGLLGGMLFSVFNTNPEPIVLLALAIIGGFLSLVSQRFMIILATSFEGAWVIVASIALFATRGLYPTNVKSFFYSGEAPSYAITLCWLILGTAGFIVQHKFLATSIKQKDCQEEKAIKE